MNTSDIPQIKQSRKIVLLLFLFPFMIILISYWLNETFLQVGYVNGHSMLPTIHQNALTLSNRSKHFWKKIKRGDLIEFLFKDHILIKRVIGLPGEKVEWRDYQIYINGKKLDEPYQFDQFTQAFNQTNQFESVTLKEKEYFVLGDNRSYTTDSREIGPIKSEDIFGEIYYIHDYSD